MNGIIYKSIDDVDVILGNCPITIVIRSNLLGYSPMQYSTIIVIMLYDVIEQCHT